MDRRDGKGGGVGKEMRRGMSEDVCSVGGLEEKKKGNE